MRILVILFFSCFLLNSSAIAQPNEEYLFSDTSSGFFSKILDHIKVEDGIIVAGVITYENTERPVIAKLSTAGEVIWSTVSTNIPLTHIIHRMTINLLEDGFIYASSHTSQTQQLLWKVNSQTGEIEWINPFGNNNYYDGSIKEFTELDANRIIVVYNQSQYQSMIAILSKITGEILEENQFSTADPSYYNTAVDKYGNIYLTYLNKLRKYNGANLNEIIWEKSYVEGNANNPINEIHKLLIDDYGDIYLFGSNNGVFQSDDGVIVKVNPFDGEKKWAAIAFSGDVKLSDFVDRNGNFYLTYQHAFVGGGSYFFSSAKVAKTDGQVLWSSYQSMTPEAGATSLTEEQSALSLDVDCNGDVFQTGYYASSNYGPGNWGIMKLNGSTGDKEFDLTITEDSSTVDSQSQGTVVAIFDNIPVILGQVEIIPGEIKTKALYISIDPTNGSITTRKQIGAGYSWPSSVVQIKNDAQETFILKQQGSKMGIKKYLNENSVWETFMPGTSILFGSKISLSSNSIYAFGRKTLPSTNIPFHQNETDQLVLYKLNRLTGAITNSQIISGVPGDATIIDLLSDSTTSYLFYRKGDSLYFRNWNGVVLTPEVLLDSFSQYQASSNMLNIVHNGTSRLLIALSNNIVSIDKENLQSTIFYSFPQPMEIASITGSDSTLYIGGRSGTIAIVASIDLITGLTNWSTTYTNADNLMSLQSDNHFLYANMSHNHSQFVRQLSLIDGSVNWEYQIPMNAGDSLSILTFSISDNHDYIIAAGKKSNNNGTSDAVISMVRYNGQLLGNYEFQDELASQSFFQSSATVNDSTIWIGGQLNTLSNSFAGCVYSVSYITPPINSSLANINVYVMPSDTVVCSGAAAISITGVPDFTINIGVGNPVVTNGYAYFDSLCPGIYSALITDGYGDTLSSIFVIPTDSNYVFHNSFIDSLALDSIGVVMSNCNIYYNSIDSAYIADLFINADTVTVSWEIIDSNGATTVVTTYVLGSGSGVYNLQLSVFCPQKLSPQYYTITQAVYFDGDEIHLLNVNDENFENLKIYPNPVDNDLVTFKFSGNKLNLRIFDSSGRFIKEEVISNGQTLFMGDLQSGLYLFELSTDSYHVVKRIIKK